MHFRFIFFSLLILMSNYVYAMEIDESESSQNIIPLWIQNSTNQDSQRPTTQDSLNCVRPIKEMDPFLVNELIKSCPRKLQIIAQNLKDNNNGLDKKPVPKTIILLGQPGVGKSTLAQAIALYSNSKSTFVKVPDLHDTFKDSGSHNLSEVFKSIRYETESHIIILDEMESLVKQRNYNEKDEDAARTLWVALDEFEDKQNILVIGTANEINNLPKQLHNRISTSIFTINFPTSETRERIIRYYLSVIPKHIKLRIDDSEIKSLVKKTDRFSCRDLQKVIEQGWLEIYYYGSDNLTDDGYLKLEYEDFTESLILIKKNNGVYKNLYNEIYKNIKPHIGTVLQIAIPLILTLSVNYFIQKLFFEKQTKLAINNHNETMKLQVLLHQQTLEQGKMFHKEQMDLCKENNKQQLGLTKDNYVKTMATNIALSVTGFIINKIPGIIFSHISKNN